MSYNLEDSQLPQFIALPEGVELVVRDSDHQVARIYYFKKLKTDGNRPVIFFNEHNPSTPYVFDSCWCLQTRTAMSSIRECPDVIHDGLNHVINVQ